MKLELAKETLKFHFEGNSSVVLVSGKWGIGKSFLIREFLQEKIKSESGFKYLFVSAFNTTSLEEFKRSLGLEYLTSYVGAKNASSTATTALKFLESIPVISKHVKDINSNIADIGYRVISNATIWVDDLERCQDSRLVNLILGEIFSLAEQKKCKILVAANTEELGENDKFKSALEKVCTSQFCFKRDLNEVFSIGLGEYSTCQSLLDLIQSLECNNLRILLRINRLSTMMLSHLGDVDEEIKTQILIATALSAVAKYGSHPKLKDIRELYETDVQTGYNSDQAKWLHSIGYYTSDNLDKIVISFVEDGCLNIKALQNYTKDNVEQANRSRAKNNYSHLVNSIFWDFGITGPKIAEMIKEFLTKYGDFLDVYMYDNLLKVIKNAKQECLSNEIARLIPEHFEIEAVENEFSYKNRIGFEKLISDRIRWIHPEAPRKLFENTAIKILEQGAWNPVDIMVLGTVSPTQIADYLINEAGMNGTKIMASLIRIGLSDTDSRCKAIALNAIRALDIIRGMNQPTAIAICDTFREQTDQIKAKYIEK